MDKKSLERYEKLLITKREGLLDACDKNRDLRTEAASENNADMADQAANAYTKEFLYSMSNSERESLLGVEEALQRIKDREYGECIECEEKMSKSRLDAVP